MNAKKNLRTRALSVEELGSKSTDIPSSASEYQNIHYLNPLNTVDLKRCCTFPAYQNVENEYQHTYQNINSKLIQTQHKLKCEAINSQKFENTASQNEMNFVKYKTGKFDNTIVNANEDDGLYEVCGLQESNVNDYITNQNVMDWHDLKSPGHDSLFQLTYPIEQKDIRKFLGAGIVC